MVISAGCTGIDTADSAPHKDLQMLFINVGKADSALVTFDDKHYLIDTGTPQSLPALVKALRAQSVKTLEGVFLTHTHDDHTGGLSGLLKLFDVKNVYAAQITTNKKDGSNVVDTIAKEANKTVQRLKSGAEIMLSASDAGVKFTVVGPIEFNQDDDNDNSLVLNLTCGDFSCLLTGDMQFAEEKSLLSANLLKPCTLLKVGNHANPDATSQEFISKVSPQYAVISTDSAVETDTPSPDVLKKLIKAKVYVTQDSKTGILATLHEGKLSVDYYAAKEAQDAAATSLEIETLDKESELLVLKNNSGKDADLSKGWIFSGRGGEMFVFPENTVIQPNESLTIASGKNPVPADLTWEEKNVWHDKKTDTVIIYDTAGNEICKKEA